MSQAARPVRPVCRRAPESASVRLRRTQADGPSLRVTHREGRKADPRREGGGREAVRVPEAPREGRKMGRTGSATVLAVVVALAVVVGCAKRQEMMTREEEGPSGRRALPSGDRGEARTGVSSEPWWQLQYQELLDRISRETGGVLRYEYRTGPSGEEVMRVALRRTEGGGLAIELDMPPGALVKEDKQTGRMSPERGRTHMAFRDEDGDGVLDAVRPPEASVVDESRRGADGHMRLEGSADEEGLRALWDLHVGIAVNRVLDQRDSALSPR